MDGWRIKRRNSAMAGERRELQPHRMSPLPLLVAGIGADDEHDAAASNDLAFFTHATDAGANLHTRTRGGGLPRLQQKTGRTGGKRLSIESRGRHSQGGGRTIRGKSPPWPFSTRSTSGNAAGWDVNGHRVQSRLASLPDSLAQATRPADSPADGAAVSTTGPFSVIATVCSKWALGRPSMVDWVQ